MKFSTSIAAVPLLLSGLTAVCGKAVVASSAAIKPNPVEDAPAPEPETYISEEGSKTAVVDESDDKLWDSVSSFFYDNGVFDLEAIEEELHVSICILMAIPFCFLKPNKRISRLVLLSKI